MKKLLSIVVMMFSIVGVRPLFAQTAKSVSFRISNIPNKQGKVLLATANGKHYGMAEASDSVVTICLNEFPLGKQAIYVSMMQTATSKWTCPMTSCQSSFVLYRMCR